MTRLWWKRQAVVFFAGNGGQKCKLQHNPLLFISKILLHTEERPERRSHARQWPRLLKKLHIASSSSAAASVFFHRNQFRSISIYCYVMLWEPTVLYGCESKFRNDR